MEISKWYVTNLSKFFSKINSRAYVSGNTVWQQALDFQKLAELTIFSILKYILSTQNVSVARFARNVEWDFFCDFQPLCA